MNTNFSDGDGDYIILKKGNNITAMGFNISKLTNKKGTVVPAGLLSQLIKENDKNVEDDELIKTHVVDEKEDEVVSDDLWDKLLNLASEIEKRKGKKNKMIQEQEPKKKNRRTKKKALKKKSGKRTTKSKTK